MIYESYILADVFQTLKKFLFIKMLCKLSACRSYVRSDSLLNQLKETCV